MIWTRYKMLRSPKKGQSDPLDLMNKNRESEKHRESNVGD